SHGARPHCWVPPERQAWLPVLRASCCRPRAPCAKDTHAGARLSDCRALRARIPPPQARAGRVASSPLPWIPSWCRFPDRRPPARGLKFRQRVRLIECEQLALARLSNQRHSAERRPAEQRSNRRLHACPRFDQVCRQLFGVARTIETCDRWTGGVEGCLRVTL